MMMVMLMGMLMMMMMVTMMMMMKGCERLCDGKLGSGPLNSLLHCVSHFLTPVLTCHRQNLVRDSRFLLT